MIETRIFLTKRMATIAMIIAHMAACKALVDYLDNYSIDDGCDDDDDT